MIRRATQWFFKQLACGYFQLDVRGLEHIPASGGAIIAANHPNVLDGILLQALSPRPVRFLVAEELYFHRFLHWGFRAFDCVPVYRSKAHNGDALRAAVAALEQGDLLGIFPEGTTRFLGSMPSLKRGVALLALRTGAPVVPVAIRGTAEAFPDGTRAPRPGRVRMRFGAVMRFARVPDSIVPEPAIASMLEQLRARVLAMASQTMPVLAPAAGFGRLRKGLQVALSALLVVPLAGLLTRTANPSLETPAGGNVPGMQA